MRLTNACNASSTNGFASHDEILDTAVKDRFLMSTLCSGQSGASNWSSTFFWACSQAFPNHGLVWKCCVIISGNFRVGVASIMMWKLKPFQQSPVDILAYSVLILTLNIRQVNHIIYTTHYDDPSVRTSACKSLWDEAEQVKPVMLSKAREHVAVCIDHTLR